MTRIIVLAGKTFRGVLHFEDTEYDCSDNLALYAVHTGVAIPKPDPLSRPDAHKGAKGSNDT